MKKKDMFLIIGAVLIVVLTFFAMGTTSANPVIEGPLVLSGEEAGLIKIDYSTYESKMENNENFIIVIESATCGYCQAYMPILEEVTDELVIPVYYIDTSELTQDEYNKLGSSNSYLKRNNWGTPTTLFMAGDTVIDSIPGYVEKSEFLSYVEENVKLTQEENTDVE